jgi:multiple sugar transport system substrate-binding protein
MVNSIPELRRTAETKVPSAESKVPPPVTEPLISSPQSVPDRKGVSGQKKNPLFFVVKIFITFVVISVLGIGILTLMRSTANKGGTKTTTTEKVVLQYWGLWEDPNVMTNVISDFERANPNITVNYIRQDPKQYSQRLLTRVHNGTGPDIFRYHNTWLPMMQSALAPLPSEVITKDEFAKTFYSVVKQDLEKDGAIYGIPLEIDTLALFTNTQLFNQEKLSPPVTWTDFITDSKALTIKDATGKIQQSGASLGAFDNVTHAPDILSLLFIQNGATLTNLSSTVQNASDALTFYTSFAKGDAAVWSATLDPSMTAFARGSVGMYFGYSWDILAIRAINPNLQFTITQVPHLPNRNVTIASYWVEGVSNKSLHMKEAYAFMKFLAQKETAQKLYSEQSKIRPFGEPFARVDLAESVRDNPFIYPFVVQAKSAASSLFAGETQDTGINGQMNQYLANAVNSILKTDTSSDTAVNTLSQGITQVLSQYGSQ